MIYRDRFTRPKPTKRWLMARLWPMVSSRFSSRLNTAATRTDEHFCFNELYKNSKPFHLFRHRSCRNIWTKVNTFLNNVCLRQTTGSITIILTVDQSYSIHSPFISIIPRCYRISRSFIESLSQIHQPFKSIESNFSIIKKPSEILVASNSPHFTLFYIPTSIKFYFN